MTLARPTDTGACVTSVRGHLSKHPAIWAWLMAAALLMKIVVPAGYMLSFDSGAPTVEWCSGYASQAMQPGTAMAGHHHHGHAHGRGDLPCSYAAVSGAVAPLAYASFLVLALAAVAGAALRVPVQLRPAAVPFLRPPARGPPVIA